jgi:TPR repeat protein
MQKLDAKQAIPACLNALSNYPNTPRFLHQLGRAYYKAEDYASAFEQWKRAADLGNSSAQAGIGSLYLDGRGVPKDDQTALSWFRKASNLGNASGQAYLGLVYESGRNVPKDAVIAASWYRKAAEQGNAFAQTNLGSLYATGTGVPKSETQAVDWLRKAADQGFPRAQFLLGFMYENGGGVARDTAQALDWYRKAAGQGNVAAKEALENLTAQRDPDDVIAQVLNYSTFGKDEGGSELGALLETMGKPAPEGGYWYKVSSKDCVYKLHPGRSIAGAMLGAKEVNLNDLDPKNITFQYDNSTSLWGSDGTGTFTKHLDDVIIMALGQLNIQRLQRGWGLIYEKFCRGKERAF